MRLQDILLVVDKSDGSKLQRNYLKKKFKNLHKHRRLSFSDLTPEYRWLLCTARFMRGDFSSYDGWQFRSDWSVTFHNYPLNRWGGPTGPVYVLGEQGLGDEIAFSSILPDLLESAGSVVLDCDPRLIPIMERSFDIECRARKTPLNPGRTIHDYGNDPVLAMGDLMMMFRRQWSHFPREPFLVPNPEYVSFWTDWLKDKPKIGIAWKGRQGTVDLPFEGIDLQYGPHEPVDGLIVPPVDHILEVDKSIALVACLDKVITVPQTVAHYAGALGVECDVILTPKGSGEADNALDWTFGLKGSPWYNLNVYRSLYEYKDNLR